MVVSGLAVILLQIDFHSGVFEQSARRIFLIGSNQDPPRQDTNRSLEHTHVLVQNQMINAALTKQRLDKGYRDSVIGADQFDQGVLSDRRRMTANLVRIIVIEGRCGKSQIDPGDNVQVIRN